MLDKKNVFFALNCLNIWFIDDLSGIIISEVSTYGWNSNCIQIDSGHDSDGYTADAASKRTTIFGTVLRMRFDVPPWLPCTGEALAAVWRFLTWFVLKLIGMNSSARVGRVCSQFKKQDLFYWYITGQPMGTHPDDNIIEIIEQYCTNSVANLKNNSVHANSLSTECVRFRPLSKPLFWDRRLINISLKGVRVSVSIR